MTNPIGNGPRVDRAGAGAIAGNKPAETRTAASEAEGARKGASAEEASLQSERLKAVRAAIDSTPTVDRGRVEAIRDQIARGEYPLDADRVAQRFAEFEKLLHS